ncbi:hypothetical protein L1887_60522 [Cichorium endivia]|nr:hypothetical protein L1887_60522 [Cichorium endivia]
MRLLGQGHAQGLGVARPDLPEAPVTCATCDSELCFDELQDHLSTCSPEPAECEFCGLTTIKSRLALHVVDECTEAPVECPHAAFGCSWTGPRRRLRRASNPLSKQIDHAHLEDDCRFEPLKPFFGVFTHHVEQLRDENHALKSRLDELEARQYTQARRVDDCVHSLGTWYRSAGEMRAADLEQRARGSQVGVDGEWDEFPLDAQNWERSLSQQSFSRQTRAHSASAVASMDLEMWARRQYAEALTPDPVATARPSTGSQRATPGESSGSRYLTPAAARSAPTSSVLARRPGLVPSPSTSRERAPQLGEASAAARRSGSSAMLAALEAGSLGAVSPGSYGFPAAAVEAERELDRSSLDSAIASLTASVAGLSSGLNSLDSAPKKVTLRPSRLASTLVACRKKWRASDTDCMRFECRSTRSLCTATSRALLATRIEPTFCCVRFQRCAARTSSTAQSRQPTHAHATATAQMGRARPNQALTRRQCGHGYV